jgi:hypothetical protein
VEFLTKSGADSMIEVFWTKGSIIQKDKQRFSAILIYPSTDKQRANPSTEMQQGDDFEPSTVNATESSITSGGSSEDTSHRKSLFQSSTISSKL